jgi:hypothetical protein
MTGMARPKFIRCIVCHHPKRAQIEMLRAGGATLRRIAARFGPPLSKDTIHRHCRDHLSRERRAELIAGPVRVHELAGKAAEESRGLLEQLQIVRSVLLNQFLVAAEAGDRHGVATLAPQLLLSLRELGRLTGELRELSGVTINQQNVLNLFAMPEFTKLQQGLLMVARKHPEARGDIVAVLRDLDAAPTPGSKSPGANGGEHAPPLIEGEAVSDVP